MRHRTVLSSWSSYGPVSLRHPFNAFRRRALLTLAASTLAWCGAAPCQSGPVKILVGFPWGRIGRYCPHPGRQDEDTLGVPVVVENKAGAGGQIAAQALKNAPADGNTLFLSHDHTISILPQVVKNPVLIPPRTSQPWVDLPVCERTGFVRRNPAKTMSEYVAWVHTLGGKGTVGVPAPASVPEFLVKMVGQKFKLDLLAAPYRGSAP